MPVRGDIPVFTPYNPLDKVDLGIMVATKLLSTSVSVLPPDKFIGAGVYALYYLGDFPTYELLVGKIVWGSVISQSMLVKLCLKVREKVRGKVN